MPPTDTPPPHGTQPPSDATPDADGRATDPAFWRRVVAFLVDWVVSAAVTFLVLPYDLVLEPGEQPALLLGAPQSSWVTLGVFLVLTTVLVALTGSTLGHRLLGLQVWQVRPGTFALQALVRAALTCLVLPALVRAGDGRLLHDHLAGTRLVQPAPTQRATPTGRSAPR